MKKSLIIIMLVLFTSSSLFAQEEEKKEVPYWYVMSSKIPWERVDSLTTLVKQYTIPIAKEAIKTGTLLDFKILLHHTGGEYNVVIMRKFPSWDAIDDGGGMQTAAEKVFPDKELRDKINGGFAWIYKETTHIDNIYVDIMDEQ